MAFALLSSINQSTGSRKTSHAGVYTNAYPQRKAESGTSTPFFCPQPRSDYHAKAGSKFDSLLSVISAAECPDISVGLFARRFRQVGLSNNIGNR